MAEPLNATFFALRRRDRAVLAPATTIYVLVLAAIAAAFLALNWQTLNFVFAMVRSGPDIELSEAEGMRLFGGMMGLFVWTFVFLFPFFIATAAYEAACLRWMIRGEAPGPFGMVLNNDAWRVWGVYWIWLIVHIVVGFATSMLMFPIMFMMMGDVIVQGGPEPDSAAVMELQLKLQALSLIQYVPLAFIGIRLGPAAATSIARKQFSFFEAWRVTEDRFWALFGSYALLWLIFGIAHVAVFAAVYGALFGPLIADIVAAWPDLPADAPERYLSIFAAPQSWATIGIGYLVGLALSLSYSVLSYGINARAVLAAIEEGKIDAAEKGHG
jgi:hypothetical protein